MKDAELSTDVQMASLALKQASDRLAEARKKLIDEESNFIYAKLQLEKKTEALRAFRAQQVASGELYDLYDE